MVKDFKAKLKEYAHLLVEVGMNVQPGQTPRIAAPIECAPLARLGVEKVNYSPEQAALFMLLPSAREGTVEPALVKDGQVLSQGVACVNTEG